MQKNILSVCFIDVLLEFIVISGKAYQYNSDLERKQT